MKKFHIADENWGGRHRLDVRKVLEHYGAENCSEIANQRDGTTEIVHSCLLDRVEPHHSNGDRNPSAWVNVESGLYCCATYWAGDLFHLVQKLEGQDTLEGTMPVIGRLLAGTRDTAQVIKEIERHFAEEAYSVDIPSYSERVLAPWAQTHPYMPEVRGVNHWACELLRIGYDPVANRIVFPHFWKGNLVGWQARAIPPSQYGRWNGTHPQLPKYKNTHGFPKSQTLYGYDLAIPVDQAIVVESPMSVAKAYSLGLCHPHVGSPRPVATFGAKVSKRQIDLLKDFARVYVWFDGDPAGHVGERKIVENLWRHTEVRVVEPEEGRDLGDYQSALEAAEKVAAALPAATWLAEHGGIDGKKGKARGRRQEPACR